MVNRTTYSLVLGGYVNGYNIIRELNEKGLNDIALFSYGKSLASYSNKINYFKDIKMDSKSLKAAILELKTQCDNIIVFPTDDLQLENLHAIYDEIKEFCFVPFNYDNVLQSLDKYVQYSFCEKYDIPYPKTQNIENVTDVQKIESMMFPVLVKPNKLYDSNIGVFRGLLLNDINEFNKKVDEVKDYISKGVTFLASEFIPGDDTNMYSYNAYRNQKGVILNEWIGKKLTQYPDNFGMFSSASNEATEIVRAQGRKLLEVIDLKGICEPEFKYDSRDGKYKLMEITHRSTMWHRLGLLSGVDINFTLYLDAIGEEPTKVQQNINKKVHFVYMKHEILNLLFRKGYWKHFKYNVFNKNREFAVYDKNDLKPFFYDLLGFMKGLVRLCLRILKIKK